MQSAFLFCCRLFLCVSMAGCSVVGSSPADWGTITQVYLNNLSTVGTLQLNDARSGSHFIKNAPVAFRATLYNFDFICIPSDRYEMNDETEGTFDDWKQSAKEYENDTSILLVKNDEVIGYCDMYPVMEEAYNDLITGKVIIRDSMIDLFCMGGVFDVYIAMVGIVPEEATQANYLIIFDWIFEHLDEWSENDINVDHVGISVYSDMLEKFIKRFGFEYKGLNPAKGKVYEATIKALKHNSLVKKRYPHFCQKDSLDPDE